MDEEQMPRRRGLPIRPGGRAMVWALVVVIALVTTGLVVLHHVDSAPAPTAAQLGLGTALPLPAAAEELDSGALAEGHGRLSVDAQGCLDLSGLRLVWPHGWSAAEAADGIVTVVDAGGHVVAHTGDYLVIGGGGYSLRDLRSMQYTGSDPHDEPCLRGQRDVFAIQSGFEVVPPG